MAVQAYNWAFTMTSVTFSTNPAWQSAYQAEHHETIFSLAGWTIAYAILTWFTRAYFMADTVDYVSAVYLHDQGINYVFWDFRHLLWRPLGWVFLHFFGGLLAPLSGGVPRITVLYIFITINLVCGLASLFLLRDLLRRFQNPGWTVEFASIAFASCYAFLNYVHAGTSYIPGLMFLLLGVDLMTRTAEADASYYSPCGAALMLALSVCLWFPYAFAVPGALALPLFYPARNRQWRLVVRSTVTCLAAGILAYTAVLAHQRIYTRAAALHWIGQGASSVAGVRGAKRAVFGFAHSFIDLGEEGVLFKRFLLHDPYNPVPFRQLVLRASLWKMALFYLLLLAVVLQLSSSSRGRSVLAICAIMAGPVALFALLWFGGDIERYLPLYPAFFLALTSAVAQDRRGLTRILAAAFVIVAIATNVTSLSRSALERQQRVVTERLDPLLPVFKPNSRIVVVDIHDEIVNFSRSFPLNPVNRRSQPLEYALLNPGTPQTKHWHQEFAQRVLTTWGTHGDIWVSRRLLAPKPESDWGWIEHSDPNVSWNDLHTLFPRLDFGAAAGASDGFLLLLPTQNNLAVIHSLQSGAT